MQKKETNDLKVCNGWTQKWMCPKKIQKNNDLYIREIVRGPFSSPKLLVSQPFIELSTCQRQAVNVNENRNDLRHGIPNAWKEYLARKGYCNSIETRVLQKNLIPSYVRSFATDRIWNELGLPLVQGIPDPWKCKFLFQRRSVKCLQRRCAYNNKISAQIACIYDGDDEAEIEHSAKRQFNKDRDPHHDENKELFFSRIKKMAPEKSKNNFKKVKSNISKLDDESPIDKNSTRIQHGRPMQKFKSDFSTKRNVSTSQTINCVKKEAKFTQMDVIPIKKKLVQTPNKYIDTRTQTENNRKKNVQNIVCCNCTIPNHVYSNIKNCPQRASSCQQLNASNLVLCQNCENIFYKRDSQVNNTMKTKTTCVRSSKNIGQYKTMSQKKSDKRKKRKWSDCFRKGKTWFKQENLIDAKSKICCEQDLKLVCGRCNNPYLKIASLRATVSDQKTNLCGCKKEEENEIRNAISKHSMTRKQSDNIVRCCKNYLCTWTESKMYVSREDLGWTPCSIKSGNNVLKKNSCNDDVNISAMNSEIKVNPEDGDQICVEHRVIDNPKKKIISKNMMHSRSCIDGSKGNHLLEGNRYNVKKKTIKRGNKNITNTMFVEGKDNITQFQQVSNIEDNMMNDNKNDLDCDVLYCSELVKDDNSEIES
ncbi:uncharacterized protein LOC100883599 isoform X2 [Megachile rotundata]|uniref:uncharacterized protein LOC100883599 isoform X2 n=1 Tax=Megachile rotundata TaxID=143995 RepID=UPI003FD11DF0